MVGHTGGRDFPQRPGRPARLVTTWQGAGASRADTARQKRAIAHLLLPKHAHFFTDKDGAMAAYLTLATLRPYPRGRSSWDSLNLRDSSFSLSPCCPH